MLRITICDDNIEELENTFNFVSNYTKAKPEIDFFIRRFQSSYDLLECIENEITFDIYILDVIMPLINGIDVGEKIREKDDNAIIIYLTTSADYAIKSYQVFAFQYLLKPINELKLFKILDKAMETITSEIIKSFPLKTKNGIYAIRYHTLMFVEYSNHMMTFHLSDETTLTSVIMREPFNLILSDLLADGRFIKSHASFIINLNFVKQLAKKDLILKNNLMIPISKSNYTNVKKQYIDFFLEKVGEHKC